MSTTSPDARITTYTPIVATTEFEAQFPIFDNSDLAVYVNDQERTDFTVTASYAEGVSNNAKVIMATGVTGKVQIVGDRDPRRQNRFGFGPIPPRDLNLAFDTIQGEMQEAHRNINRSLKVPYGSEGMELQASVPSSLLYIGDNGNIVESDTPPDEKTQRENADRALASLIGQGGDIETAVFDTRLAASFALVKSTINTILAGGYSAPGDGPLTIYKRKGISDPALPGDFSTADGASWELAKGQDIHVEMFGARPLSQDELIARAGTVSVEMAANDAALAAADAFMAGRGGGRIYALGQFYVLSKRYERSSSVYIIGAGVGEWEPIYPQRPKTWEGTTFLFKATGAKEVNFDGITSGEKNGGWRPDPDNSGQYFKLWSAYNNDANGTIPATKRQFSAAVLVKENVRYGGLQHLRICNWVGTDGISDWSNRSMSSLGDEWDFGYVIRNGEYTDDFNIQVVGGFREAAVFHCVTAIVDSAGERNRIVRGKFNGRRGLLIRGPDIVKVLSTTSNSITLPWTTENYHNPNGGTLRGSNNINYTYTGITHVGSDPNMVLTGVTPDPTGITSLRHASAGVANTEYENCYIYGLDHVSGARASSFGFPDSRAVEVSGFPVRGIKFDLSSKFHTAERVVAHLHHVTDLTMFSTQFEGGGHVIATPAVADQSWAVAAVWETRGLVVIGGNGLQSPDVDDRLFTPRNGFVSERNLSPRSDLNGHVYLKPEAGKDAYVQNNTGSSSVRAYSGGTVTVIAGGAARMQFFTSGSVGAGSDNTQALGTSAFRWAQLFAGTATINTSDERLKRSIEEIQEDILDAWEDVAWCQYRFLDGARLHTGLVAQKVKEAFEAHGLDAFDLGLLCYDEWGETPAVVQDIYDADGNVIGHEIMQPPVAAGDLYGLRYEECFAVEAAYQRRRMRRIEEAIASMNL